jgi:hypothetical protein
MTQREKILLALQVAGRKGINSYTARQELQVIQLPTRVWELKKLGHNIIDRTNPDKSVNYILLSSPVVKEVKPIINDYSNWVFDKSGRAYLPEQGALL